MQRMRCPERSVAERIADQEAWYYGAPERNRPGADPALTRGFDRGAWFIDGLPEGTVIECRTVEPRKPGPGTACYVAFTVRRKSDPR